jgi:hypothetical protein
MRIRCLFLVLTFVLSFSEVFAQESAQQTQQLQWAPVPYDANEPVTASPHELVNPQERGAALSLLDHARQNYNFYGPHTPGYRLKLSFNSNGSAQYEGSGSMEETWTGQGLRWTANIGSSQTTRVAYRQAWSDNPSAPVPMRIQMARAAVLWPVMVPYTRAMLRGAPETLNGKSVLCVLISGSVPNAEGLRHWYEREYCVEPQTGNLMLWSEAPGHYVIYDYTSSTQFQGHVIANDLSIYEAGARVMQIHVDSLVDASGVKPESLRPTTELMAKGTSFFLRFPERFPLRVLPPPGVVPALIQPVIVHATLDRQGHVLEAEVLQNSGSELATKAIEAVRTRSFGGSPGQREVFVNVQFFTGNKQVAAAQ